MTAQGAVSRQKERELPAVIPACGEVENILM